MNNIKIFFSQIKNKIRLLSYNVVLMLLIIGVLVLIFTERLNQNYQFAPLHKLQGRLLDLDNIVSHFIVYDSQSTDFLKSGDSKFIQEFNDKFSEIQRIIKHIKTQNSKLNIMTNKEIQLLESIQNDIIKSKKDFIEIKFLYKKRGNTEQGLISSIIIINNEITENFENISHPAIDTLKKQLLYVDFLSTNNKQDFKTILNTANRFAKILSDSLIALNFSAGERAYNLEQTQLYKLQIEELHKLNKEIGIYHSGKKEELNLLLTKVNHDIDVLKAKILNNIDGKIRDNNIYLILLVFFFSGISLVIINYIQKSITSPLEIVKKYTAELALGKFPDKIFLKSKDEVTAILKYINYLVDGMKLKANFAKEIGKGNLDTELKRLSEYDTLSTSLIEMQNSLKIAHIEREKRQEEERQQKWINKGITDFVSILRQNNNNLEVLGDEIIRNIVHYIDAAQGGIFLFTKDDQNKQYMELIASYAYDRKKFLAKQIELGEGLIGSIALEQKIIHLHKLPANYLEITSGLGEAQPSDLIILPLIFNDVFYGAIEVATFNLIEDYKIEFLKTLSDNIASTFASVQVNMQTRKLLEQSNIQAEELASQEEEMRQNMEELQATQEEASRRELALQELVNAINAANFVIEYDAIGKITSANKIAVETLNIPLETIIGKSVFDFVDNIDEINSLWEAVLKGNIVKQVGKIRINNKTHWFNETYSPLKDENGMISKVLKFAIDITETKDLEKQIQEENLIIKQQEDRIKQKMKEFEEKEDELLFKNAEINDIKNTIDSALYYAEFDKNFIVSDINQRFLAALGYSEIEIRGLHHDVFNAPNEKMKAIEIMEELRQFELYKTKTYKKTKNGELIFTFLTYSIVVNHKKNNFKIIFFGHEVLE
jgi:methyl-accepting chemotaxis protein